MSEKTILVVGTFDTKDDELTFLAGVIRDQGGRVVTMDVSVLGDPSGPTDYSKHDVAKEDDSSIDAAIAAGDENKAMQIMGGIGYTEIYPIEKMVRDIRLSQIWTGTNEIMALLIQHEYYKEVRAGANQVRNVEMDARGRDGENEKCFTDEDMWRVHAQNR